MTSSRRVAAIDCGTNSIRLLVADATVSPVGVHLVDVHRQMRIVRLGEGVDRTGRLAEAAIDRTWRALSDYAAIIAASGVSPGAVRMTATSATRDAANRDEFVAMVVRTLGQEPEVIAGTEEAALSFAGALGDLPAEDGPFLVFDIGGGSTEFVVGRCGDRGAGRVGGPTTGGGATAGGGGDAGGGFAGAGSVVIDAAVSEDIGSVRITERMLPSDPPTPAEIAAARAWAASEVAAGLDALGPALGTVRRVVGVAGTTTTVAAAALDLPTYDPTKIHGARLRPGRIRAVSDALLRATRAHRALLGYLHPGRVDVIGGGALILAAIAEALAEWRGIREITVSEHDILDGIALSLAR